jgi:NAD(P)-dependent dehydrogenase (short-subunit alcohol dehydrogenase family)
VQSGESAGALTLLHGDGVLTTELAGILRERGTNLKRTGPSNLPTWDPQPDAAVYVVEDPDQRSDSGSILDREPASAYRFGLAALSAFENTGRGSLVYVSRSFVSSRGVTAYPEAFVAGAGIIGVVRALAARTVGTELRVNLLAVGIVDCDGDPLRHATAGPMPAEQWVAAKQGRLMQIGEVASALSFLVSPSASLLNGATLSADRTLSTRL